MKWWTAWYNLISQHSLHRIKIYWSSDQRPKSLHSSPNHSLTHFHGFRPQTSITLFLWWQSHTSVSHSQRTFSASFSLSLSQILNLKSSKPGITSPNPLVSYSHTNALCLSLSNLYSPFTNFIRHLKTQIFISLQSSPFKSLHLRSSQQWTDHTLKLLVLTLSLSTPRSKP